MRENVMETVKTGVATAPIPLKLFGILVADWVLILSALVSIVVLIEKIPMLIKTTKQFIKWIKSLKKG